MRALMAIVLTGSLGLAASTSASVPTVNCAGIIGPDHESALAWRPKRVILGVVAAPPAYIPQTTESVYPPWRYWSKSGLVVRANSPVVHVSVPVAWRRRAAIGWGGQHGVSSLRILSCPAGNALGDWNPYAGGFYLRSRAACLPLTFTVAGRSATVRFGVGKRCA